jgi:hypothetical protein
MYFMPVVPQVGYTNPSFMPKSKINIGIPVLSSFYVSSSNSGFAYNDIIQKRADDSLVLNMENLIKEIDDRNYWTTALQTDLLSFGIRIKKNYFSFNATEKVYSRFIYPKDMIQMAWEGNGKSFVGKRINMDALAYDFSHYREYSFGYAREFTEKLTVGAKLKYLYGMENVHTQSFKLGLTTDENTFDLTLDAAMHVNTAGLQKFDGDNELTPGKYLFGAQNRGFGMDLGASYNLNEKISLSASVLDLGFIHWKDDIKNYVQDEVKTVYRGIDMDKVLTLKDMDRESMVKASLDSAKNIFDIKETSDPYTTILAARTMIGGSYKINNKQDAGAIIYTEFAKGRPRMGLSLSYNTHFLRWLSASVNYSVYNRSYFNIGTGLAVNLWPVQLYLISDNVASVFVPHMTKNVHLRTGINIILGRKAYRN